MSPTPAPTPIQPVDAPDRRRWELGVFLFVVAVLIPLIAVLVVAGYGFAVWIWQIFTGPPTV